MKRNHKIFSEITLIVLGFIAIITGVYFYKIETVKTIVQQARFELKTDAGNNEWLSTGITEKNIKKVEIINDSRTQMIQISVTLDAPGRSIFEKVTAGNIGRIIGIFIDDTIISVPIVNEVITDGKFVISGDFTEKEALNIKARLLGYYYANSKEYKNIQVLNKINTINSTAMGIADNSKEIKASHLLICYKEAELCSNNLTKEEALEKIQNIQKQATPQNFSDLVKKYSDEPGANESGGDLGWFTPSEMVEQFRVAIIPQPVGTISEIVETQFGFHLIYKQDERMSQEDAATPSAQK